MLNISSKLPSLLKCLKMSDWPDGDVAGSGRLTSSTKWVVAGDEPATAALPAPAADCMCLKMSCWEMRTMQMSARLATPIRNMSRNRRLDEAAVAVGWAGRRGSGQGWTTRTSSTSARSSAAVIRMVVSLVGGSMVVDRCF